MRSSFILASLFLFSFSAAQKKHIDSIDFNLTQDITFFRDIANNTTTDLYVFQDGNRLKVGDTLFLGTPSAEASLTTAAQSRSIFGGKITSARTSTKATYSQIQLGKFSNLGATLSSLGGESRPMADLSMQGTATIIREIRLFHKGSKKKPLMVSLLLGEINDRAFGLNKYLSVVDTEIAYAINEIQLANRLLTREEAIAQLKEAKDLYDLDIITKEEYEAKRAKLEPIIRQQ